MSVSTNVVKTIQAKRLIFNIDESIHQKNQSSQIDPLWKKMIQTIDTILEENCIDEDLIEKLKIKKSRLELEIAKSQIKKLESPPSSPARSQMQDKSVSSTHNHHHQPNADQRKVEIGNLDGDRREALDEKASGERIQKLLEDQKDIHSKELIEEQQTKNVLLQELSDLTSVLKSTTLEINHSIQYQNQQLIDIQKFASENQQEIENQKKKMAERTKGMTTSIWTNLITIAWMVALFVITYIVIRLFPKPTSNYICQAKY